MHGHRLGVGDGWQVRDEHGRDPASIPMRVNPGEEL
jgi:hypothetical protein